MLFEVRQRRPEPALMQAPSEGGDELERDPDSAESSKGIFTTHLAGIQDSSGGRQFIWRAVMIGDDEAHSHLLGVSCGGMRADSAIDRHHRVAARLLELFQTLAVQAVSLIQAARNVVGNPDAHLGEKSAHERRSGDAVHVIIPIHADGAAVSYPLHEVRDGLLHSFHQKRIVQSRQGGIQELARLAGVLNSPLREQLSHQRGDVQFSRKFFGRFLIDGTQRPFAGKSARAGGIAHRPFKPPYSTRNRCAGRVDPKHAHRSYVTHDYARPGRFSRTKRRYRPPEPLGRNRLGAIRRAGRFPGRVPRVHPPRPVPGAERRACAIRL